VIKVNDSRDHISTAVKRTLWRREYEESKLNINLFKYIKGFFRRYVGFPTLNLIPDIGRNQTTGIEKGRATDYLPDGRPSFSGTNDHDNTPA
jgi:hypothetical protein